MADRLLEDVNELIRLGHGDLGRLTHIKKSLENNKSLFKSDLSYVSSLITRHLSEPPPPPPREQIPQEVKSSPAKPEKPRTSNTSRAGIAVGAIFLLILAFVFILPELDSISFDRYVEPYVDPYVAEDEDPYIVYYDNPAELPLFVNPYTDPQYYVNRYNSEPDYKEWFDTIYPEYSSIYEAVGLDEPPVLDETPNPVIIPEKEPKAPVLEKTPSPIPTIISNDPQQEEINRLKKENERLYAQTNPVIAGLINGKITYYIDPLPSFSTYDITLFDDYLNGRTVEGIKLERVYDENKANFYISWIKDYGPHTLGVAYSKGSATIGLGSSNCGDWQHFDNATITRIAWHEIGHIMGYGHSDDPNNVMYPTQQLVKYNYDRNINNEIIAGGWYWWWSFCNDGKQYYHFKTDKTKYDAFELIVVPSKTNVTEFIIDGIGTYYSSCEEFGQRWFSKSGTCNVEAGSKIIIHNTNEDAIRIEGYIQDQTPYPEINMQWDDDAYEYDPEYLDYIRDLFSDQA